MIKNTFDKNLKIKLLSKKFYFSNILIEVLTTFTTNVVMNEKIIYISTIQSLYIQTKPLIAILNNARGELL
jgi:hypothetical protein